MKNTLSKSHFHAVYKLNYHLVLVTKYRHQCINQDMLARLREIFDEQCKNWSIELLEFNGESDHVHLLLNAHPALDLSKLINSIKTVSSRLIRKEFATHLKKYYWKPVFWTRAYCLLTCGGAPLEIIKQYIEKQDKPKK
jgi:putative transposase